MTTDRATGIETTGPTDDESDDQITQLLRRVEALEAEKAQLEERFESELDDVRSELADTVADVMPDELATLKASGDSIELARTIGEAKVRRVPVGDENGDLEGLVTLDDLIATIGEQFDEWQASLKHNPLAIVHRGLQLERKTNIDSLDSSESSSEAAVNDEVMISDIQTPYLLSLSSL